MLGDWDEDVVEICETLPDADGVKVSEGVCVMVNEAVPVSEGELVALAVRDCDTLGVEVWDGEPDVDGVLLTVKDGLSDMLGDCEDEGVADCEVVLLTDGVVL